MSLILPASSSPELKAFPLCSKSSKSSEGGQMSCLLSSELSAAAIASAHISAQPRQARLCDLFRSASAPLHKSHRLAKARFKGASVVMLSVGLCQSRKDRYLPPERLCVRLLPRPNGLASSRFQKISVTCYARAKNLPPPPRSRVLTDASASVLTSPSCPARRLCQRMYIYRIDVFTTTFSSRSKPPL